MTLAPNPTPGLRTLLAGSVDYAGLFPPASLDLSSAVRAYAEYRAGSDAWALGRFVVPAGRLAELEGEVEGLAPSPPARPWRLSVLLGPDAGADLAALGEFNRRHAATGRPALVADVVELKAGSAELIGSLLAGMPPWAQAYVEIPLDREPGPLVAAIARGGGRAKMRTGGITPESIPPASDVLRFLRACLDARVPFKATAGLHHPLRAEYRLTYAPDSPRGTMFGFVNVFLTAVLLRQGLGDREALALLDERAPDAFEFDTGGIGWRGHRADLDSIERARGDGIVAFGSCSFVEPVGESAAMGW
jgi:hypothetical protein